MTPDPPMEIVEFGRLDAARRRELEGEEQDPFDAADSPLVFRPKERHVALRDDRGRLVASTGMVIADVEAGGRRFPVVGIGGVIVAAPHRGRGLARRVVEAALRRASTLGPSFALLFCHEDRAGLYRRLGFTVVAGEVLVDLPDGPVPIPEVTMWRALTESVSWPAGRVEVHGLPF
jgi:predicted N-acetyltransferase YhbS